MTHQWLINDSSITHQYLLSGMTHVQTWLMNILSDLRYDSSAAWLISNMTHQYLISNMTHEYLISDKTHEYLSQTWIINIFSRTWLISNMTHDYLISATTHQYLSRVHVWVTLTRACKPRAAEDSDPKHPARHSHYSRQHADSNTTRKNKTWKQGSIISTSKKTTSNKTTSNITTSSCLCTHGARHARIRLPSHSYAWVN